MPKPSPRSVQATSAPLRKVFGRLSNHPAIARKIILAWWSGDQARVLAILKALATVARPEGTLAVAVQQALDSLDKPAR